MGHIISFAQYRVANESAVSSVVGGVGFTSIEMMEEGIKLRRTDSKPDVPEPFYLETINLEDVSPMLNAPYIVETKTVGNVITQKFSDGSVTHSVFDEKGNLVYVEVPELVKYIPASLEEVPVQTGKLMGIGAFAKRVGVSIEQLRKMDAEGTFKPYALMPSGHRKYTEAQVVKFINGQWDI